MVLDTLKLTGEPYERGVKHGEKLKESITNNIDVYKDRLVDRGLDISEIKNEARKYSDLIQEENSSYYEEMEGVSEGGDFPIEDITMLNVRYELYYSTLSNDSESREVPDGCTSFGVNPEATSNSSTIIGQNWDWIEPIEIYVRNVRRKQKPDTIGITEAGIVTSRKGFNEYGIGFVTNGLATPEDGDEPYRKPYHLRCQEMLDAERPGQAVEAVIGEDRVCSANFIIGHPAGEMVSIETTPSDANYIYPTNGLITHANHFEKRSGVNSTFEKEVPHTILRKGRLQRKLSQEEGDIDTDTLMVALQDHFNWPSSICSHPDPDLKESEQEHSQSLSSMIFDLSNRKMLITEGPPCQNDYRIYSID